MRVAVLLIAAFLSAAAAPAPQGDPSAAPAATTPALSQEQVRRLQAALATLDFYVGPENGVYDRATDDALRAFRRGVGLAPDDPVDASALARIESRAQAALLLSALQRARADEIEAARAALRSDPATRDLVDTLDEPADPTRDAAACLDAPTVRCLIAEAAESAKAVADAKRRDWAFSEILAVAARAGLDGRSRDLLRRIEDPRRILRALRTIAVAHARGGDVAGAIAAAERIPDAEVRAAALAEITHLQASDAAASATPLAAFQPPAPDAPPRYRAIDLIDLALTRLAAGDAEGARELLREGAETLKALDGGPRRAYPAYRLTLARIELAAATGAAGPSLEPIEAPHLIAQAAARLAAMHRARGEMRAAEEADAAADAALAAVPSRLRRIWTAAEIAETLQAGGEPEAARAYLERARSAAEAYRSPWGRARALARLADGYLAVAEGERR
ncbi:MAG: peptidoglycan-binding domain-containing protein [Nitratireductor sp.]